MRVPAGPSTIKTKTDYLKKMGNQSNHKNSGKCPTPPLKTGYDGTLPKTRIFRIPKEALHPRSKGRGTRRDSFPFCTEGATTPSCIAPSFEDNQEQPLYSLPQKKKRALIPRIIILIFLSILFYLGILLNISLLELTAKNETTTKTVTLISLSVLVVLGIFLTILRANRSYHFYQNRVILKKKEIFYSDIKQITVYHNLFDKLFNTYSLHLGNKFQIKNIPKEIDVQKYIQQLISYSFRERTK